MHWRAEWIPEAFFLDRDGTLIRHIPYLHDPDGVELLEGIPEFLSEAKALGCRLFLHTNQSGVGRGMFTMEDAHACNQRMLELIGLGEGLFDEICIAPEHPDEERVYRKPSPRFALEMAERCGLDAEAAKNAGMHAIGIWNEGIDAAVKDELIAAGAEIYSSISEYWRRLKETNAGTR